MHQEGRQAVGLSANLAARLINRRFNRSSPSSAPENSYAAQAVIAIEGKTACGLKDGQNTALHTVTAYATASGLCWCQEGIWGKGNAIPAIQVLRCCLTPSI
jgi:hypothetical protein